MCLGVFDRQFSLFDGHLPRDLGQEEIKFGDLYAGLLGLAHVGEVFQFEEGLHGGGLAFKMGFVSQAGLDDLGKLKKAPVFSQKDEKPLFDLLPVAPGDKEIEPAPLGFFHEKAPGFKQGMAGDEFLDLYL